MLVMVLFIECFKAGPSTGSGTLNFRTSKGPWARQRADYKLHLLHQPVLVTNLLDEIELGLAPVHVFLFVFEVFLHDVEGGDIFADFVHALAEEFDAIDRDLMVAFDVFAGVGEEFAFGTHFVFQLTAEVEEATDELVDPAHFLVVVPHVFGAEFLKALVGKDLALQFVAESLIGKVGYENCNALIDFCLSMIIVV